jgi:hypothetical protein
LRPRPRRLNCRWRSIRGMFVSDPEPTNASERRRRCIGAECHVCLHGFELLLTSDLLATWDAEFERPNCTPSCEIAWRRLRSSRTCFATSAASSSTAVTTLQAQSLQISPFCTDTPRSKNGARTASRLPSKDCVGSNAPSQFHRDEIAYCLNSPFCQPDEEYATARRQTRRDACPENRDVAEATALEIEEARQGALLAWKAKRRRDFARSIKAAR